MKKRRENAPAIRVCRLTLKYLSTMRSHQTNLPAEKARETLGDEGQ